MEDLEDGGDAEEAEGEIGRHRPREIAPSRLRVQGPIFTYQKNSSTRAIKRKRQYAR